LLRKKKEKEKKKEDRKLIPHHKPNEFFLATSILFQNFLPTPPRTTLGNLNLLKASLSTN
jgi:hypothetical protein